MSKNFWCVRWNRVLSRRGLLRSIVAGGAAITFVAVAVPLMSGLNANAAQATKPGTGSVSSGANAYSASSPASNAARGKDLFKKDGCYECHGYEGQGSREGVRIAPDPLPAEGIAAYIRKPAGQMPPYTSKMVPDQDVADIYAYLKTVPGPTDIKNIPTFTK